MSQLKKISIQLIVLSMFFIPLLVVAQRQPTTPPAQPKSETTLNFQISNPFKCNATGDCDLMSLITAILNNIIMPIAAVAVVLFIIYAGFSFVMAQGNEKKVTEAKQMLLWGLIGGGILLGAVGISQVVQNTVNQLIVP